MLTRKFFVGDIVQFNPNTEYMKVYWNEYRNFLGVVSSIECDQEGNTAYLVKLPIIGFSIWVSEYDLILVIKSEELNTALAISTYEQLFDIQYSKYCQMILKRFEDEIGGDASNGSTWIKDQNNNTRSLESLKYELEYRREQYYERKREENTGVDFEEQRSTLQ